MQMSSLQKRFCAFNNTCRSLDVSSSTARDVVWWFVVVIVIVDTVTVVSFMVVAYECIRD